MHCKLKVYLVMSKEATGQSLHVCATEKSIVQEDCNEFHTATIHLQITIHSNLRLIIIIIIVIIVVVLVVISLSKRVRIICKRNSIMTHLGHKPVTDKNVFALEVTVYNWRLQ